jgi:hypothetical protein
MFLAIGLVAIGVLGLWREGRRRTPGSAVRGQGSAGREQNP